MKEFAYSVNFLKVLLAKKETGIFRKLYQDMIIVEMVFSLWRFHYTILFCVCLKLSLKRNYFFFKTKQMYRDARAVLFVCSYLFVCYKYLRGFMPLISQAYKYAGQSKT